MTKILNDTSVITLRVNGMEREVMVYPQWTLSFVLREKLGLTGTKVACDEGACGACTVLVDGRAVLSCLVLAVECQEKNIQTIEGIAAENHPILDAWVDTESLQCGYCTPGVVVTAKALLDRNPDPSEKDVVNALQGNVCRCGTYPRWTSAVKLAVKRGRDGK